MHSVTAQLRTVSLTLVLKQGLSRYKGFRQAVRFLLIMTIIVWTNATMQSLTVKTAIHMHCIVSSVLPCTV